MTTPKRSPGGPALKATSYPQLGKRFLGLESVSNRTSPSDAAKENAGTISGRERIEVIWAVPRKGRTRPGTFWSSFPTNSQTTLTGIVNTAFKTNEDRHDILQGAYNAEILVEVLPNLVAASLGQLVDPEDPGFA